MFHQVLRALNEIAENCQKVCADYEEAQEAAIKAISGKYYDKIVQLRERWAAAEEIVAAYNDLPPTYNYLEDIGIPQFIPDPCTYEQFRQACDRVDRAEAKMKEILER